MANSKNQHPLVRDGRSQTDRLNLHALAPESVSLDDRQERQLLVYLNEFAKSVAFYDTDETPEKNLQQSNWQSFFRSGSSVQVSLIEAFDTVGFENQFNQTKLNFQEGLVRNDYAFVFDFLFESALTVNAWYDALSNDIVLLDNKAILNETPLRRTISNLITSNLKPTLAQLIATANLFVRPNDDKGYQVPDLSSLIKNGFWDIDPSVLASRDTVLASLNHRPLEKERILRERLDEIFQVFAKSIRQIVALAAQQDILQATKTHEPHLALLYTFLRLLRPVLEDFNQLPKRHLNFYYRDVLQLTEKKAIPDSAHVIFELPKNSPPQYKLENKTLLKGGKDTKGQDIRFALDNEIVVNRAQIAELRTLFHNKTFLNAHPKANSEDGLGKEFSDPTNAKWATLGSSSSAETAIAKIGLAIVSPTLILEKGKRQVQLILTVDTNPNILSNKFYVRLSGEKGWILPLNNIYTHVKSTTVQPNSFNLTEKQILIQFELGIKEDAVVAANPSVLGVNYGIPNAAVLQLFLKKGEGFYNSIKDIKIQKVEITTTVSELQNVKIRTDEGEQDPTKPFMPFGAVPSVGSTFSIGSDEIFSKKLTAFGVHFEWDKLPAKPSFADFADYYSGYDSYGFQKPSNDTLTVENSFQKEGLSTNSSVQKLFSTPLSAPKRFDFAFNSPTIIGELLKFQLNNSDFRHIVFPKLLAAHTLANTKAGGLAIIESDLNLFQQNIHANADSAVASTSGMLPDCTPGSANSNARAENIRDKIKSFVTTEITSLKGKAAIVINPPYTPVIKNLSVSYTAKTDDAKLFHIYPFDEGANFVRVIEGNTLIINTEEQGSLLIGLTDAAESSLQSLLFQFLESSALSHLPKAKIEWQYLDGNQWQPLEKGKYLLNDATNEFIQSGIVDIILPKRSHAKSTTILPPQYYWLKASCRDNIEAICQAIGVHTQAVRTTFEPTEQSDTSRLALPLAAGSVSKLDIADPNIKSATQLYPSFDGQPAESSPQYYRRVSERLKHKGRAVTLYDYEQLILEAFPEVFKVKCIPHTFSNQRKFNIEGNEKHDIHFAPSHVTIVVVPNISKTKVDAAQLHQPTASRGLLERITVFLKKRTSPFVKLQVLNPIYESIRTQFYVQFQKDKSPEFYRELLSKDINQFLAPWAFDPTATVTFGGVVYRSSILGFIENRDYVDYVVQFEMFQSSDKDFAKDEIKAATERVVLTTFLAHNILFVNDLPKKEATALPSGIGFDWKIP